ncbi:MCP four helix bundle domain-containing protein [Thiothrix litoralis]|uniref:MCP four helix bundle domain-containing protein n=1 Tax=Thiothrix litoralis TaxID=2891210 RepID=A0ABX7WSZ4_9GAMM|nr:MCP four helix bundle domain-containing protein [Thiothrix litoralis]QTR46362.1 MCP four helix bundle domain-containing protein [Thiothrix litoralis]
MKKIMQVFTTLVVSLLFTQVAQAAVDADAIKTSLMAARENLVAMIAAPDAADQDKYQEEITKATKGVDDGVAAALADKETLPEEVTKLEAFNTVWGDFKKTRDDEIIPAVKAGKVEDAKQLATTIQAERMKEMKGTLTELGAQPDPEVKPESGAK